MGLLESLLQEIDINNLLIKPNNRIFWNI